MEIKTAVVEFLANPAHQLMHRQLCEHRHGSYEELLRNLHQLLSEKGFQPKIILARGFKGDLLDAHPAWREFAGAGNPIMHIVLRVGNLIIDIAGSQFGTGYGNTMFRRMSAFRQYWRKTEDQTEKMLGFWKR